MTTPGCRVRILAEWYSPILAPDQAQAFVDEVEAELVATWPSLTLVSYVETNPPAEELI